MTRPWAMTRARAMTCARALAVAALVGLGTVATPAQVSGTVFEDRNGDGLRDAGEAALSGVTVRLFGRADGGSAVDAALTTAADGAFSFGPGHGCYLLGVADPPGWRRTAARFDLRAQGSPGYAPPAGLRRFGGGLQLLDNLRAGALRFTAMGDSIAYNWNSCFDTTSFYYSQQIRDRLACVAPAASVTLDQAAIKGDETENLLTDDPANLNNVFSVLRANPRPQLVTISIIGNDLLGVEPPANPTPQQLNAFAAELVDARANLQELVSSLVAGLPGADVELNTLYDNLAYACSTSANHREWLPIVASVLRDVAWGQARRVTNAEVHAEFARQDLNGGCTGFQNLICTGFLDGIHPRASGYRVIREKLWEALDGVNLGPKDGNGATSIAGADHGYLRRVVRLYPTRWETRGGASADAPEAAFREDDGGAGAAIRLGTGAEEFRVAGFPGWYDEVVPVKVVAGVRYRTTGAVTDDFYRIEASVNDQFRPPAGHAYAATSWNFYTPIVGTGGPNAPAEGPDYPALPVLVTPNVAEYRTVSALLTKNPTRAPGAPEYTDPPLTRADLASAQLRVAAAPVAGTPGDDFAVVLDAAWLDVYGWAKPRPPEIAAVAVERAGDGGLRVLFDALAGSEAYHVYAGSLAALPAYDHGSAPGRAWCDAPTTPAGPGRLAVTIAPADVPPYDAYVLVTGRVDGVESPAGLASSGAERDRSRNTCP